MIYTSKIRFIVLWMALGLALSLALPTAAQEPCSQIRGIAPDDCLVVTVQERYPHATDAFTQGLIWLDGALYESTGLRGESTLREVTLESGEPVRSVDLADEYFAEGLELVNGELIQLTWQAGEAFVYDPQTFERVDTYTYEGEGWGLCYDGRVLYMSDSTPYLSVRDADTFDLIVRQAVTYNGTRIPAQLLNELECVGDSIYANLWQTNFIVEIDKYTGDILHWIDATQLLTADERSALESGAVLNGIAYNPDSETFYITGKLWADMFEVTFEPVAAEADD